MEMAGARFIQAFPPGMVVPAEDVPVMPPRMADKRADLARRRTELIGQLAALSTHSHRRIALQARLAELTRQLLALEARR